MDKNIHKIPYIKKIEVENIKLYFAYNYGEFGDIYEITEEKLKLLRDDINRILNEES